MSTHILKSSHIREHLQQHGQLFHEVNDIGFGLHCIHMPEMVAENCPSCGNHIPQRQMATVT